MLGQLGHDRCRPLQALAQRQVAGPPSVPRSGTAKYGALPPRSLQGLPAAAAPAPASCRRPSHRHRLVAAPAASHPPWTWEPPHSGSSSEEDSDSFSDFYGSGSESNEGNCNCGGAGSWAEAAADAAQAAQHRAGRFDPRGQMLPPLGRAQLREAALQVKQALCSAGCHEELAEELLLDRPELALLDLEQQVRPKLAAVMAAAEGFTDDEQDLMVRCYRTSAELLLEAVAWPCSLRRSIETFRAGLGLLLQLVAAARGAPRHSAPPSAGHTTGSGSAAGSMTAGKVAGSMHSGSAAGHGQATGVPGAASNSTSSANAGAACAAASAREVLLELSAEHARELLCAGCGRVAAAMDALQAYLGWPPQLAARALLGCPTAQAARAVLGQAGPWRSSIEEQCNPELLAEAVWAARPADSSLGEAGRNEPCPFAPSSLPRAHPGHMAQVAAWLGHLGLDRRASALLTASTAHDWAAHSLADLQRHMGSWAAAAELDPDAAAAALWLAGVPPGSQLASHFARLARQGTSSEQLRQLAVAVLCYAPLPAAHHGGTT